jgi:LmbE family N-acetylglucosaminyl deacetylase
VLNDAPGARVLVLAPAARAPSLRARVPGAQMVTDADELERLTDKFDTVYIEGCLEDEPWDRWLLQRVRGCLRDGATLIVQVPALLSLASIVDLRFLAYVWRKAVHRLMKRWVGARFLPARPHRRYSVSWLARQIESLGFTVVPANRPPAHWLAGGVRLSARKAQRRPLEGALLARAEQRRRIPAAREAWLARFPEFRSITASEIDATQWRGARVLVLSPHPDDELIGCGGTLLRLIAAGASVTILQATDGSALESLREVPHVLRRSVRIDEARRVAAAMGAQLVAWGERDGGLRCTEDAVKRMRETLERLRPTQVFTPFLSDMHPDHRELSRILSRSLGDGCALQVLQYEVWALVPANLYCNVAREWDRLERLLLLYERAMQLDDFVLFCEQRNLGRGRELTGSAIPVEAFLATSAADFRRLAS